MTMMETIRHWDLDGDLCQGDVVLFRLPEGLAPARTDIIPPHDGKLVLAEGEITGHGHAIWLNPPMFRDDGLARELAPTLHEVPGLPRDSNSGADVQTRPVAERATAVLYRDVGLVRRLMEDGLLTEGSLCVGFLALEAAVLLRHQEHDAVGIPPGVYYVGRQREFHSGEARRVSD
jgi:hypothetical protein